MYEQFQAPWNIVYHVVYGLDIHAFSASLGVSKFQELMNVSSHQNG